ncbi:uncharacterized protein M421DRAFT_422694 [Didymella exigua CBS 183.55]|uniref:Sequence orphan n=1 Tax=Didymella exigua CBS 183.55 TaxID=1150837 RepID=A0A6A5RF72_9PLEO|nr:uncharacterized protein M421DRAFT_422694 [Didymella exigua CBS 183.55]KAF1926352.1 hypothetical protein M421DRAFT_422694 [Didymella exigua CBS 183.55]
MRDEQKTSAPLETPPSASLETPPSASLETPPSASLERPPAPAERPPAPAAPWDTARLPRRLLSDALAAGCAGALVAPVITVIDKGIMENASGRLPLGESLRTSAREMLSRPARFVGSRPFALIFSLYFGTYLTANAIDTLASARAHTSYSATTAGSTKFVATSSANLALCLYKDSQFTQLFGARGPARPVPLPTFALFTVRDCLTIFASFNLPPLLAPRLEGHMSEQLSRFVAAASLAQFATPAAIQVVSTPLHLLGLDLYNRPAAPLGGPDGRVGQVVKNWAKSAVARMGRIVPAFGVGGVVNTKVRRGLMEGLE